MRLFISCHFSKLSLWKMSNAFAFASSRFPCMSGKSDGIMLIPHGGVLQKGMENLKQVVISMVIVLIAAGILAGMVLYTVALMRSAQLRILTGESAGIQAQVICR